MKQSIRHLLLVLAVCCSMAAFSQSSNSTAENGGYVKSKDLNVDTYIEFAKAIKADGRFEINSACIPAHLFHVRMKDGSSISSAEWTILEQMAKNFGLLEFIVLQDYTDNKFMEDCSAKRSRQ
jgi:hypothetical protein